MTTRKLGQWRIDGVHPAEYAAQWGAGNSGTGALFYNCSDMDRRTGEVIANPDWGREDWERFAAVVREQCKGVAKQVATPAGRKSTGWTVVDAANLQRLGEWAEYMARKVSTTNPFVSSRG